ncbi:MAG TPA: hypothetical protein VJI96_01255 [Candidatus Andersenbacteria bacterium]|nr:hypothetical protein [Candidatus Andersenbacteria bacterium]
MEQERTTPSAEELILCKDPSRICETYLFEPAPGEKRLGYLFAAAETEDRGGVGKPLLDMVITAIQREYYREPSRSASASFEMALHQANLILYDSVQAGTKDWMGHFHVAIGVLAGNELHLSVAGAGAVFIARKTAVTNVSQGISHFPITDPLKTFSQVATGDISARDTIFFTSSPFDSMFRSVDVGRFALEHSASTIAARLEGLYLDQGQRIPLAVTVVTLLPEYISEPKQEIASPARKTYEPAPATNLTPRVPLIVKRSIVQQILVITISLTSHTWKVCKTWIWPVVMRSSTGVAKKIPTIKISIPRPSVHGAKKWALSLPSSSKLFAIIAIVLLVALLVSIVLLQKKRASDAVIEQASQRLHEARTKVDAAKTALIYDNREQATGLLADAKQVTTQLLQGTLYLEDTKALALDIQTQQDRLQKIFRSASSNTRVLGDLAEHTGSKAPNHVFFVNDSLYAVSPNTNAVIKMGLDGKTEIVHATTEGIGFIAGGSAQNSDKTIIFNTDSNTIALFDAKDNSLTAQEINIPAEKPEMSTISVFGNRLYVYEKTLKNILSFNKTLRGYSGGTPWITDEAAKKLDIQSIAIDGNIYALAKSGEIIKLFRGASTDFVQATVEPTLSSATKIVTSDTMQNLYVLDPTNKRVVILSKKGALIRQLFFDEASSLTDISVVPDEQRLFALNGTKVLEVTLTEDAAGQ